MSAKDNNGSKSWNVYIHSIKGVTGHAWKYAIKCVQQHHWLTGQDNWYIKGKNSKIKKELTDLRESVQYHSDNIDEVNKRLRTLTVE